MNFQIGIAIFTVSVSGVFAQTDLLSQYMQDVRAGKSSSTPAALLQPKDPKTVLLVLSNYESDTVVQVRSTAYSVTRSVGMNTREVPVRQLAVSQLIQGGKDNDGGIVGEIFAHLAQFRKQDFNNAAKDSLKSLFRRKPAHFNQLIKLAGFLEMRDLQNDLLSIAQPGNNQRDRWAALLALARMGESSSIASVNTRARKLKVNDDVIAEIFPDLIYTRQPELINYVIEVLQSDEPNCESADNDHPTAIPCGYRIMEQLAGAVKNYPLTLDASGDIETGDYKKALATVRQWFKERENNYELDRETY